MGTEQTTYSDKGFQYTVFPNGTFDESDIETGVVNGSGDWSDINALEECGELTPELRAAWLAAGFSIPAVAPEV